MLWKPKNKEGEYEVDIRECAYYVADHDQLGIFTSA